MDYFKNESTEKKGLRLGYFRGAGFWKCRQAWRIVISRVGGRFADRRLAILKVVFRQGLASSRGAALVSTPQTYSAKRGQFGRKINHFYWKANPKVGWLGTLCRGGVW